MSKVVPKHGIGWAIRRVRKGQGRTLEDLAAAIGSDAGNLSRIERGRQDPTERVLLAIAAELRVNVSDLWELAETGGDDTGESGRILALTAMLNQEERERLLDYAGYLLERQSE